MFCLIENFNLDDFNTIDMNAKKVLIALSEFEKGLLIKDELIHKKTGQVPFVLNEAIKIPKKSLLVDVPDEFKDLSPYNFYSV